VVWGVEDVEVEGVPGIQGVPEMQGVSLVVVICPLRYWVVLAFLLLQVYFWLIRL
jgi:hypothetical protein